jgi:hypothetical protein
VGWADSLVTVSVRLSAVMPVIFALFVQLTLTAVRATDVIPPLNTATEAINKVFRQHRNLRLVLPLSDQPVHSSVRPLCNAAVKPVHANFSVKQQENIDAALHALNNLVAARDRLAKALGIEEKWWPTGIERLKVDAVLTRDVLTGRTENPNEMSISSPELVDKQLDVTIQEDFTEHGQDRVLGHGHRTLLVTLISEKNSWVINEIKTKTTDAYGDTTTETLTERLQEAVKCLDDAKHAIERLPERVEIKRGVKTDD